MLILGINAYHGDAAAAIVRDGQLIAAAEEERFNRIKHCAGFPTQAIQYCLKAGSARIEEVDHIGISRDPSAHLHKKVLFAATRASKGLRAKGNEQGNGSSNNGGGEGEKGRRGDGIFGQIKDRLSNAARVRDLKDELARVLAVPKGELRARFHNIEHHRAHLASSFFVSPFERAALLSIDGFGDFISTMWALGEGNSIKVLGQVEYPHSTGIVYTATTQFLGFPHYGDEGKVMGLAPYGRPRYMDEFRDIIRTRPQGHFELNLECFRHHAEGVDMSWDEGSPVIGRIFSDEYARRFGPPRQQGTPLTEREEDIAASLQLRLEEVAFHVLHHLHERTGLKQLGLSGGVAYNSVMNGKILLNTPFEEIYVQPAAGDSGTALGVCYQIWHSQFRVPSSEFVVRGSEASALSQIETRHNRLGTPNSKLGTRFVMEGAYTGPEFSDEEIAQELGLNFRVDEYPQPQLGDDSDPVYCTITHALLRSSRVLCTRDDRKKNNEPLLSRNDPKDPPTVVGVIPQTDFPASLGGKLHDSALSKRFLIEHYSDEDLTQRAAQDIADGLVVGWFQGRMEFGPRALGNRSIVVDPRRAEMKQILNERIKKREPFRPFAPSILEEHTGDYFEQTHPAPTMLMVYQIKPERRAEVPAVTHVDGSGRLQTVSGSVNTRYYQLISDFYKLTGVPIVLNTSFNENEPIVCTPRQAIGCFLKTRMDVLYVGNYSIRRIGQRVMSNEK